MDPGLAAAAISPVFSSQKACPLLLAGGYEGPAPFSFFLSVHRACVGIGG